MKSTPLPALSSSSINRTLRRRRRSVSAVPPSTSSGRTMRFTRRMGAAVLLPGSSARPHAGREPRLPGILR